MAIYSCNLSSVGRTSHAPGTAGCHLRYISRNSAYPHVEAQGIPLDPGAAQVWMDQQEAASRANARLIDKICVAIPRELSRDERAQLVRDFVGDLTQGRVSWMFAIHQDGNDAHNPHSHIAIYDREPGTGQRVLRLSDSARDREKAGLVPKGVDWVRERWEHHANLALERAGHDARIDRRTLNAQGIDREPTIHIGPRAQHIESYVERPHSKIGKSARGREIDYPTIDQGRTRMERNDEIIAMNLLEASRSPHLDARVWAQFERGQRGLDAHLEQALAKQARTRTSEERTLKAGFRAQFQKLAETRREDYRERLSGQRASLAPRVHAMRERQGRERIALHQEQSGFWAKLCRAVDITGGTRRRHQATRRALVAEHKEERDVMARVSRAEWMALKHAVHERYAPQEAQLRLQRKGALSAQREMHGRAEAMADNKRQIRAGHRERDRLRTEAMLRDLKAKMREKSAPPVPLRPLVPSGARPAFKRLSDKLVDRDVVAPRRLPMDGPRPTRDR